MTQLSESKLLAAFDETFEEDPPKLSKEIASQTGISLKSLNKDRESYNNVVKEVMSCLQCSKCSQVPRNVPMPCCSAGHIICRRCKDKVTECPTCRKSFAYSECTNSVASNLASKVTVPCQFSSFGCTVKDDILMMMDHVDECPERQVTCPYCLGEVQLKKFHDHCNMDEKKCYQTLTVAEERLELSHNWMTWDGVKDIGYGDEFNLDCDIYFKMSNIRKFESDFYIYSRYNASKKHFVFFVMTTADPEDFGLFNYKMTFSGSHKKRKRDIVNCGPVLWIEEVPKPENVENVDNEVSKKCVCISYEALKSFFSIKDTNDDVDNNNHLWMVILPFAIEITQN